jgi:hypothetical protein
MADFKEAFKQIDSKYNNLFDIEIEKLKTIGVDNGSIKRFITWVEQNPIDVSDVDSEFDVQEQFLNLRKVTWDKIRVMIVEKFGSADYAPIYDHIVENLAQIIKFVLTGLFDSLLSVLNELQPDFPYKDHKTPQQFAIAIIIKALDFQYVERAYFEFIKTLFKALIKFFLYNNDFDVNDSPEQQYVKFLQLYRAKIERHTNRLEREFDSWLYDWDNLGDITRQYIKIDDFMEYNKTLAKTYAGDFI